MNRIDKKFSDLRKDKKKAFIAFITAGDPNLKTTEQLVLAFEKAGADIVELGVPFSDPLADGPTIQAASERALKNGVNLDKILECVRRIRRKSDIPIVLMTYYNPIFHYNERKFIARAKKSGVDGVIVPDLPPEEAKPLIEEARAHNLSTIFFLSPTTTTKRIKKVAKSSTGFIYFVSIAGVTGARQALPSVLAQQVRTAKRYTKTPICVGFGVSTAAQVKSIGRVADGVIVGSAIVKKIYENKGNKKLVENVTGFVKGLAK